MKLQPFWSCTSKCIHEAQMLRCKFFSGYEPPWGKCRYNSSYVRRKELMDKNQLDISYANSSPKFRGIFSTTVQPDRGKISLCFLSLQTQDSRAKFTSQIHLPVCTIFLFNLYFLIVLLQIKLPWNWELYSFWTFFHAQSTDLK